MKKVFTILATVLLMASLCGFGYGQVNIGLLVSNINSLDVEEGAAYDFATSHGFTVAKLDPSVIQANPSILDNCCGFWAANNSEPSGFNTPTIVNALRSRLENGKGMFLTWYGFYFVGYLGLGTTSIGSGWGPAVSDHEYWVDKITDSPIFSNLTPWLPPVGPPDDESKLLWYVTPGYIPGGPSITWSVTPTQLRVAQIWASYGWCGQTFDPNLCAQYGITCTCERSVQIWQVLEAKVGEGSVIVGPPSMAGGDHWHYGAMGSKLVENILNYICSEPHAIPTLTEWGLIIFGVVLLGFITWVFLKKRRRVIGVRV
ncbi:MAG: hypothetical protein WCE90_01890 [Candidatus Zixiibacteriota bacterium]